jgi:hypothetical protein
MVCPAFRNDNGFVTCGGLMQAAQVQHKPKLACMVTAQIRFETGLYNIIVNSRREICSYEKKRKYACIYYVCNSLQTHHPLYTNWSSKNICIFSSSTCDPTYFSLDSYFSWSWIRTKPVTARPLACFTKAASAISRNDETEKEPKLLAMFWSTLNGSCEVIAVHDTLKFGE